MKMNRDLKLVPWISFTLIAVEILVFAAPLHAEMNFMEMRGVHELLNPDYDYLSPVFGFTLLETKTLENMRFYGNYGPEIKDERTPKGKLIKKGFGCLDGEIGAILKKNQDCPQDSTSELIQRLFPAQDRVNFVANQIDSDIVSHLKPETIGKVLGRISQIQDSDLTDPAKVKKLTEDLKSVLFESLHPKKYYDKRISELQKEQKRNDCSPEEKLKLAEQISSIEAILKFDGNTPPTGTGKEKDFEALAKLLVEALKESRVAPEAYTKHFPEQALLSFFLKKGNEKKDYLSLFQGMTEMNPRIMKGASFLKDPSQQAHFLSQHYSKADYDLSKVTGDPIVVAEDLIRNPEKLVFYALQEAMSVKPLPPILSYAQAKHSSLAGGSYPDCGETSLRNFFNIALYNQKEGKFDVNYLAELKEKNPQLQIHPNLVSFYQQHFHPASSVNQGVRDDWSEMIASKHEGVNYLKPRESTAQCEINAGVDNMMAVIDHLLFKKGPIAQAKDRAGKLDELCKALSREGFDLSWKVQGANGEGREKLNELNTGVNLEMSINGKPSFIWQFMPGHFVVQEIHEGRQSWKDQVGGEMAKRLSQNERSFSPLLLHWFSNEKNWDQIGVHSHARDQESLLYGLPLSSNETKLFAFQKILLNPRVKSMKNFATRIQSALPENDLYTQQEIHSSLADNDYPFGDPSHAIGKVDAIYTRVSQAKLSQKYGGDSAKKMGRSWERVMHGHKITIGEPLLKENGEELKVKFEQAIEKCLELNPEKDREKVKKAFQAREAALDQIRKSYLSDAEAEVELTRIHSEMPIPGIYLMSEEEWKIIEGDFGYREKKYIPQILPKLFNRVFWSSTSGSHYRADNVFMFDGDLGVVYHLNRKHPESVRCGAAAVVP
jgi:hypothetical protein